MSDLEMRRLAREIKAKGFSWEDALTIFFEELGFEEVTIRPMGLSPFHYIDPAEMPKESEREWDKPFEMPERKEVAIRWKTGVMLKFEFRRSPQIGDEYRAISGAEAESTLETTVGGMVFRQRIAVPPRPSRITTPNNDWTLRPCPICGRIQSCDHTRAERGD